mmetsp:Transcript_24086/g.71491  ORF Transcript_24086/g.71491 Transcript_24086/m.71491 type:complete len:271 (-) Transcript_24086:719-1531(-)
MMPSDRCDSVSNATSVVTRPASDMRGIAQWETAVPHTNRDRMPDRPDTSAMRYERYESMPTSDISLLADMPLRWQKTSSHTMTPPIAAPSTTLRQNRYRKLPTTPEPAAKPPGPALLGGAPPGGAAKRGRGGAVAPSSGGKTDETAPRSTTDVASLMTPSPNTRLKSSGIVSGLSTCSVATLSVALKIAPSARQSAKLRTWNGVNAYSTSEMIPNEMIVPPMPMHRMVPMLLKKASGMRSPALRMTGGSRYTKNVDESNTSRLRSTRSST